MKAFAKTSMLRVPVSTALVWLAKAAMIVPALTTALAGGEDAGANNFGRLVALDVRFEWTDPDTKEKTVFAAPAVTAREGHKRQIEVIQEWIILCRQVVAA